MKDPFGVKYRNGPGMGLVLILCPCKESLTKMASISRIDFLAPLNNFFKKEPPLQKILTLAIKQMFKIF